MPISFVEGDLFASDADALVNAVNCVGVMGGGIAAQFKERYPEYFLDYKAECAAGRMQIGKAHVWVAPLEQPRYIVSFPTKQHWRSASRLADVEAALQHLRLVIQACSIESIAIPALGCGLGGLDFADVRPLLREFLTSGLDGCKVSCYEPS